MAEAINILPPEIANQIAAGEVVRRPASALKELIENSLDASATNIEITICEAGKKAIYVMDNGHGMHETDARSCFSRHATSKINSQEDLQRISTFGFRGEALASIASIARVSLKTKQESNEMGAHVVLEKGSIVSETYVKMETGTWIEIKDLFYSTPARKKFLNSEFTEMKHIMHVLRSTALAHPEVAFTLSVQPNKTKTPHTQLSPSRLKARILALLGKDFASKLLPVEEKNDLVNIFGYIGKPEAAKKSSSEQWLFVNKRYVRHNYLQHAIRSAYESLIPEKSYPFFVLFLEIDYQKVDVNIHPSKAKVKFEDEDTRKLYTLFEAVIRKTLGKHHTGIDFGLHANFRQYLKKNTSSTVPKGALPAKEREWAALQDAALLEDQYCFDQTQKSFAPPRTERLKPFSTGGQGQPSMDKKSSAPAHAVLSQISAGAKEIPFSQLVESENRLHLPFFHINKQYVCKPLRRGLLVIDRRRAQERIFYELFSQQMEKGRSQKLVFPQKITCSEEDILLLKNAKQSLLGIGFTFNIVGKSELVVTGLPVEASTHEATSLFEEILECLSKEYDIKSNIIENRKKFWQLLAQRLAAITPTSLEEVEMQALMDRLYACKQPNYTPKGEYISKILDNHFLTQFFNP